MRETSLLADRKRLRARLVVSLSGPGNLLVSRANPDSKEDRKKETFPAPQTGLYIVCCNQGSQRKLLNYKVRPEGKKIHSTRSEQSRTEKGFVFKTFVLNFSTQQMQSVFSVRYFIIEV